MKDNILISRCILGIPCRYHGQKYRMGKRIGRPSLVARLQKRYNLIDICPEVDAGLTTPRPPTRIVRGRWICEGKDVTAIFRRGAQLAVQAAIEHEAEKAYLLKLSPACDSNFGCAACALKKHGVTVISV